MVKEKGIIAEFAGSKYIDFTDWNLLMAVVEKIESMGYTTSFKTHYCRINPIHSGSEIDCIVWCHGSGMAVYRNTDITPSNDNNWCILREESRSKNKNRKIKEDKNKDKNKDKNEK